jgi:mono/diheme cytochrome c family protein
MIPGRMARVIKVVLSSVSLLAAALVVAACGTQKISVPHTQRAAYSGAVLFAQRCSGCHTLSYAATHGSAANARTREPINGPNFNVRCERPITRVLYAIENGGFSGAYMPQNVVVGQQARDVAEFVSQYAGRQAPVQPGQIPCQKQSIGTLPTGSGTGNTPPLGSSTQTTPGQVATTPTTATSPAGGKPRAKKSKTKK